MSKVVNVPMDPKLVPLRVGDAEHPARDGEEEAKHNLSEGSCDDGGNCTGILADLSWVLGGDNGGEVPMGAHGGGPGGPKGGGGLPWTSWSRSLRRRRGGDE